MAIWLGDAGVILPADTKVNWIASTTIIDPPFDFNSSYKTYTWQNWDPWGDPIPALPPFNIVKVVGGYTAQFEIIAETVEQGFDKMGNPSGAIGEGRIAAGVQDLRYNDGDIIQLTDGFLNNGGQPQDGLCVAIIVRVHSYAEGYWGPYYPPDDCEIFFGTLATQVPWDGDEFSKRRKITVKKEAVTGAPTNIPVFVDIVDPNDELFFSVMRRDASYVKVTTDEGVEIPSEIGALNLGNSPVSVVRLFFLASELSSTSDTDFYLYYESSPFKDKATTSEEVWSTTKEMVNHFGHTSFGRYKR